MSRLIDQINGPQDLKGLALEQLTQLAQELREIIIETTSLNGGHVAPSLGVVELVIGLHYCFDSPKDKLIFDVGHQTYAHKLLTGRRDRFHTLRQYGGICGFPRLCESEHDAFGTGHGSTSIAAALGYARARDVRGTDEKVVALIGDGAMLGGMVWEALNSASHAKTDLIVVINDNEMSIARNIGALPNYLARLRSDPHYLRTKQAFESLVSRLPRGDQMIGGIERMKDGFKHLLVPGMVFEELGFTYLGPIDGHNLPTVIAAFQDAQAIGGPVVVHTCTVKGKGYPRAEEDARRFHGCGPYEIETGDSASSSDRPSFSQVFGDTMIQIAEADPRVVAVTAAMPDGTGLREFADRFPDRLFDVGMAEQTAVTFAAGLVLGGLRPVVAIYSTFLQRAYDQLLHDVCLQNLPVVFALDRAGLVGNDGPTHHGVFDLSYLCQLPNMVVMAPKDENELRQMIYTAVYHEGGPVAVRYPRGSALGVPTDGALQPLPLGKGELLREGTDVGLLALGSTVATAVDAAARLEGEGLSVAVANLRFAKPLDEDLIVELAETTDHLFTLEENVLSGGFGSQVAQLLRGKDCRGTLLTTLGIPDRFVPHGTQAELRRDLGLDAEGIAAAALSACGRTASVRGGTEPGGYGERAASADARSV
ncbi:MAG: 1-deoxy-D-xylulose-5-phosphate synthase [Armatimonadetes bacterium CG_4_10_14_3_um_filter_66_18]|nr:1-deoxy-D-xylulose-5-phosphate synthase [Armatimonadota bacterium]PIU90511.1 MAG: 1-deoxy-D-xylulose-5-phosphate synthase [Armatimonadetes bacterium CG06_land_8_20_14_3_00_66_21]PIX49149.1 MAG: 1-deoxy-D-xylulose-5-phosphate synthase [Armatimonadetes bacterium CG_4_8_14_3_um_filter_66_20]PIY48462.1 MAG: 1-deoxy-D-xylulose-5-phosphate synthase [Armatimonadetes bacterium CG_4_10_14_3_um_filter_66_18]PIZ47203.1 MAG: 1-deoxy-D-xylulose-5-phosphate synthase [Armatimonadetes bacterium CG_4_10_14_0